MTASSPYLNLPLRSLSQAKGYALDKPVYLLIHPNIAVSEHALPNTMEDAIDEFWQQDGEAIMVFRIDPDMVCEDVSRDFVDALFADWKKDHEPEDRDSGMPAIMSKHLRESDFSDWANDRDSWATAPGYESVGL